MNVTELNRLLKERREVKQLLRMQATTWDCAERERIGSKLSEVVYRTLPHLSNRERASDAVVVCAMAAAKAADSNDVRGWQASCSLDLSSVNGEILKRIETLAAANIEDLIHKVTP